MASWITLFTEHLFLQGVLTLLDLNDESKSDMENVSDIDEAVMDADYELQPQEQGSSEDYSSGDEDPIPQQGM